MSIDYDLLLLLKSAGLGDGEPDLGEKLMVSFLTMLRQRETIPARIICMNSGIFLTTDGSPVAEILQEFENDGSKVLSCGTCLDYYGRTDKLIVGSPTNMEDTVRALLDFKKVLSP